MFKNHLFVGRSTSIVVLKDNLSNYLEEDSFNNSFTIPLNLILLIKY